MKKEYKVTRYFVETTEEEKEEIYEQVANIFIRMAQKELKNNKFLLRKLILELYINYNCTQKEIGECLQINKIKVNRIIKNEILGHSKNFIKRE